MNRPPLKWVGGKSGILPKVTPLLPEGKRLVEPFVGGGAVFLNTEYDAYLLCDINQDLINFYIQLKTNVDAFINVAKPYFAKEYNDAKHYYALRSKFNISKDVGERAVLFLYLNRFGFNGLCRYNKEGEFNVAFGKYEKPYFPELEMRKFSELAQKAEFKCQGYQDTFKELKDGDVVYCDPPYLPLNATSAFTNYHTNGFALVEHEKLSELITESNKPCLLSNSDTDTTRRLYHTGVMHEVTARRNVSADLASRGYVGELLIRWDGEHE